MEGAGAARAGVAAQKCYGFTHFLPEIPGILRPIAPLPLHTAMPSPALAFGVITLIPVPLLALGATLGGPWAWFALVYLTLFAFALDELTAAAAAHAAPGREFPAADALSVALALAHFALMTLVVCGVGRGWVEGAAEVGPLLLAAGLFFGQISNSNAHELIHRSARPLFVLGKWVFISLLFGHHVSAHPQVHHRFVGSDRDPNSARLGQSYYRFAARAWRGSFLAGLRAESARRAGRGGLHPYWVYVGGAGLVMALALALGGPAGLAALVALALFAQSQLLLSDYVQHYGLRRREDPDGRLEPVAPRHSWNAPHWFTGHMMLNAPRHSDHHAHPARPFPDLAPPDPERVPMLPRSLPVMSVVALLPPLWRRSMDPRARAWNATADRRG